jgi:hypothetical protein
MESTLQTPAIVAAKITPKATTIIYWAVTALFCLQMSFTSYAQLRLPEVAEAFTRLGFPGHFRVELSWPSSSASCCWYPCRRGSRSGPTPASPSTSPRLGGVGLGIGHRRALGTLVLLLAPPAGPRRRGLVVERSQNRCGRGSCT